MKSIRLLAALVAVIGFMGCGGGSSPTAPSAPPPAPAPTPTPAPTPPPNAVLRSAAIRGYNGHACGGSASILREDGQYFLELGDDFRVNGGVNEVILSVSDDPQRDDLRLGNLASRNGKQRYSMPDDGSRYRNVLIWCRPYTVTICFGELG